MALPREEITYWPQLKTWLRRFPHGPQSGAATLPVVRCHICMEDGEILTPCTPPQSIGISEAGIVLFCGHIMHKECYDNWAQHLTGLGQTVTCPTCRLDLVYTKDRASREGCVHTSHAYPLPVTYYQSNIIPPTKPEGGLIPNFCHPCRVDSMKFIAGHISDLRRDGYDDFQVRNVLLHTAGEALELTDFERQVAFPPNANGVQIPWVAPPSGQENDYLFVELREQLRRDGNTWRGPAPVPPPVGYFGLR
ncbi:hypothetical protein QBC40DRAFT_222290 [Triangularia verruculosa]|uniref:RING-type domain-containing protein n=1 Tax=Triangularia verruculosa TaxID=2587418 RepID=A0AAN6XMP7_9PEZI|nr:hypothetical protein QBC40DRAFT_222290 [Triangularia verruculosa]